MPRFCGANAADRPGGEVKKMLRWMLPVLAAIYVFVPVKATAERARCGDHNAERNVYWGELHVHTTLSSDAWISKVRTTPDSAYRFARGESILIPPLDDSGNATQSIRLERPLDFAAVTDHAEAMGLAALCTRPEGSVFSSEGCNFFRQLPATPAFKRKPGIPSRMEISNMLCGEGGKICLDAMKGPWEEIRNAASAWNDTTDECSFTTFNAYEWSGARGGPLLHRNVIYRNDDVAFPVSSEWYPRPRDLLRHLEDNCLSRGAEGQGGTDCDVLVIPHNSNTSQGTMWDGKYEAGEPEVDQAKRTALLEPIVEIMQHKGDSECRNGFSNVLGGVDELCDFEKLFPAQLPECTGKEEISYGAIHCTAAAGYARYGLAMGIAEEKRIGVNPYKYGVVAATDAHNGNSGQVAEGSWRGHVGTRDATFGARTGGAGMLRNTSNNPGGIAAIWAEENSREALFLAMRRKETYGTSGPRMTVRLFGGWEYPDGLCEANDFVAKGYAGGVPMGGTLGARPEEAGAPRFAVRALRDVGTEASPGGLLQRVQMIKVWPTADGKIEQRIYDIAGDANNGASVDMGSCQPKGPGADQLCSVWSDPDFDSTQPVAYYARVVENPSCRWTMRECALLPAESRPDVCSDPRETKTVQERAWTSPIWYEPAK